MLQSEKWAGIEKRVLFLLGQASRSVIGSSFWLIVQVLGPAHELHVCLQRCSLGRAFVGKPVHEGPQVYEPDKWCIGDL